MKSFKILAPVLVLTLSVPMLCACDSVSNAVEENSYVGSISADFDEIVNTNRELGKVRTDWQITDKESSEKYLKLLDDLSDAYLKLRNRSSTDIFGDEDKELDSVCNTQLTYISQEKALVQYAYSSGDMTAYSSGIESVTQNYTTCYNTLNDNISSIKTIYRNG